MWWKISMDAHGRFFPTTPLTYFNGSQSHSQRDNILTAISKAWIYFSLFQYELSFAWRTENLFVIYRIKLCGVHYRYLEIYNNYIFVTISYLHCLSVRQSRTFVKWSFLTSWQHLACKLAFSNILLTLLHLLILLLLFLPPPHPTLNAILSH